MLALVLLSHALLVGDALLAHGVGLDVSQRHGARVAADIHDVLEGHGGDPALGLPCLGDLCVKLVDLLQGETLGLVDKGPDEEDADEAASGRKS